MTQSEWKAIVEANPGLMGLAKPRLNKYIPQVPTPKQAAFLLVPHLEALFGGAASPGKCQPYDAVVMTPFGPSTMGEMKVGTQISNPDGSVAKVIQIREVGEKDVYKVKFNDGSSTRVTEDHLWLVRFSGKRQKADKRYVHSDEPVTGRVCTTAWLIDYFARQPALARDYFPIIPVTKPVEFTRPIGQWGDPKTVDPYVLGVLLGDGCLRGREVKFASADQEIIDAVNEGTESGVRHTARYDHRVCSPASLIADLEKLGVYGKLANEKFVPACYKMASIDVRWAILQGLMDTDGTADPRGHCSYASVSKQLAEDVQWIVRSLGGNATITTKDAWYADEESEGGRKYCQLCYIVYIQMGENHKLFRLDRKIARCVDKTYRGDTSGGHGLGKRMESIEKVGRAVCRCIAVDNPNRLYLTDDFIVTHNTSALLMAALQYVDVPGYSALILRKTYADLNLPGAIMDRAKEWLMNTDAHWSEKDKTFRFPSGATLTFGFLDNPNDIYRYQGSEYHFCAYDELTQFSESAYTYLFSRLRRNKANPNLPIRMRSATNPGGIGAKWVKRRFMEEKDPDRVFIRAKVQDNPHVDIDQYTKSLGMLDDVLKAQLLDGDWDIQRTGLVYPTMSKRYPEGCFVPPFTPPKGRTFGGIDWGFTGPACFLCGTLDEDDVLWVWFERYIRGQTVQEHIKEIPTDEEIVWFADPAQPELIQQMRQNDFVVRKALNQKQPGIDRVTQRIRSGKLRISTDCTALFEESTLYRMKDDREVKPTEVSDPDRVTEEPIKKYDHSMDALRYMISGIAKLYGLEDTSVEQLTIRAAQGALVDDKPRTFKLSDHSTPTPEPSREEVEDWNRIDNEFFWGGDSLKLIEW